jgi:hypothetical protein
MSVLFFLSEDLSIVNIKDFQNPNTPYLSEIITFVQILQLFSISSPFIQYRREN